MQSSQSLFLAIACTLFFVCCNDQHGSKKGSSHSIDRISALIALARSNQTLPEIRKTYTDSAQMLLMQLPDDTVKNNAAIKLASVYFWFHEFESYNELSRKILQWSLKVKDTSGMARALGNIGTYFSEVNQSDSAYYYLYNANKMYSLIGNQYRMGRSLLKMGLIQADRGDFIGGEAATVRAISHFYAIDNVEYLAYAYNNLGIIYGETGQYERALEDHQKSLDYKRKLNNELSKVTSLNNIGLVKLGMKDYEGAIEYYKIALSTDSLYYKDARTYAMLLNNITHANFLNGNTNGLPESYFEPLRIRDSINHVAGVVSSNLDLSAYYKSVKELDLAKSYAQKAAELSSEYGYDEELLKSLLLLSEVTDAEQALTYTNRYIRVNDSLQREERNFRNQFARIRFDTDQLEKENEQISRQKEWLIIGMIGVFLFVSFISVIVWQRFKNRKLINDQKQQRSNEEIYRLMLSQQFKLNEGKQLERKRFSEELHDGILGRLFGVRLSLDSLSLDANKNTNNMKQLYVDELKNIEQEVRQISHDLSADQFSSDLGYTEVIEELIIKQCNVHSVDYEFYSDDRINWEKVPDQTKMHLYRIIQESLQNVNKYAEAENVKVRFETEGTDVELVIEDNGIGFEVGKKKKGIGLKNIASRAKEVNGKFELKSAKGKGTKIKVIFPPSQNNEVKSTILSYETASEDIDDR